MQKAYYFLWRRPGMSRSEFIEYYEEKHADLIIDNLPRASDFRRNFPRWAPGDADHVGSAPFDVLTAITYPSLEHFEAAMHVYHTPPFNEIVVADELRFIDRSRVRFVPLREVIDGAREDEWFAAPTGGAKLLRLTRCPLALDAEEFRRLYETHEVAAVRKLIDGCSDYRRNYLLSSHSFNFTTPDLLAEMESHGLTSSDLIEEFCFPDRATAAEAARRLNDGAAVTEPLLGMLRMHCIEADQHMRVAPATS